MGTAGKLDHSAGVRHILHPAAINLSLGNALFLCPTENRQETSVDSSYYSSRFYYFSLLNNGLLSSSPLTWQPQLKGPQTNLNLDKRVSSDATSATRDLTDMPR